MAVSLPAMRRALWVFLFVGLGCGLLLYLRRGQVTPVAEKTVAAAERPPRLAFPVGRDDAGTPDAISTSTSTTMHAEAQPPMADAQAAVSDEQRLMQQLRNSLQDDPQLAENLARKGQERFPNSPSSDERDMFLVLALFNLQRIDEARREAYAYMLRHPTGRYVDQMSSITGGVRPRQATPGQQR